MVKIFGSEGGDVSFAGDAMIVLWATNSKDGDKNSSESLETCTRRAAQCAIRLMNVLGHKKKIAENVTLSVKIGVGSGEMAVLRIGGVHQRMEAAVGDSLSQAFSAEHHAMPGHVIFSPEAHRSIARHVGEMSARARRVEPRYGFLPPRVE